MRGRGIQNKIKHPWGRYGCFQDPYICRGAKTLIAPNADRHPLGSLSNPFLPTFVDGGHVISPMNVLHWRLEQGGIRKNCNTCESNGLQQKK